MHDESDQSLKNSVFRQSPFRESLVAVMGLGAAAAAFSGLENVDAALVTTGPLLFGAGNNANWDVDGVGGADFRIFTFGGESSSQMGLYAIVGQYFRVATQQVFITDAFNNTFSQGFVGNYANGAVLAAVTGTDGNLAFDQNYPTFPAPHTGNFVFKFDAAGTTSIGWANITFTPPHGGGGLTAPIINAGEYFPVANGPITVGESSLPIGEIPEPAHTTAAVLLLGMGAYGLRAWRKRKKTPQVSE